MPTIANVTISVGTNTEQFPVSNPGWTAVEVNPPFGIDHLKVTNTGGVNSAYNGVDGHTYLYRRNETPADKNQSVTLRILRRSAGDGAYWHAVARLNGNNFIYAIFEGATNRPITLGKCVGGVRSALGTVSTDSSRLPTDGSEGDLTLEVTGMSARVLWNGVEVIAPQTFSEPVLDTVGYVGMGQRSFNRDTPTTLYHLSRFTALDGVGADTTAPTLTSPTATATGSTTASGTVSTNEANGTLYRLATTNATETAATVKAANQTQTVTATGVQNVIFSGLTASTTYYAHYVHTDTAGNDSTRVSSASFTTSAGGDVTPPTLTSPSGTATTSTTATGSVSTNEANGTLHRYVSTNASESAATVKAASLTTTVTATGVQNVSFTGLTANTTYYAHYVHRDAAGNDSAVSSSASFLTPALATATFTIPLVNNTNTPLAGQTVPKVLIVRFSDMTVRLTLANQTSNGSGNIVVNSASLTAGTAYAGFLINADGTQGGWHYGVAT